MALDYIGKPFNPSLSGVRSLMVGDWNGDGKPDSAIASFSAGQGGYTWVNSGVAAAFFPVANLSNNLTASSNTGASTGIAAGDLNVDGKADLVALYTDGNIPRARPYVSQGKGTVTAGTSVFCSDPFSAAISDIDEDG